jgi:hypothetical protein
VSASLISYELGDWDNPQEIESDKQLSYLENNPDAEIVNIEERQIDGNTIVIRDSIEGQDKCADRIRQIYMVHEGRAYQISIHASCRQLWDHFYPDIEAITNRIEFR